MRDTRNARNNKQWKARFKNHKENSKNITYDEKREYDTSLERERKIQREWKREYRIILERKNLAEITRKRSENTE